MSDFDQSHLSAGLSSMDPSISDGYRIIYDREVPFELRLSDSSSSNNNVGTLEAIKCKVLVLGDEHTLQSLRLELSSDSDLFFSYIHVIDEQSFSQMQETQKLMIDYNDYPSVLIRMLNNCISKPQTHLSVFIMQSQADAARLDFIQNMEYKFVELLSLHFTRTPEEIVQHQIAYRYNCLRAKLEVSEGRLKEVYGLVKVKNPSLLLQLQKGGEGGGGGSRGNGYR